MEEDGEYLPSSPFWLQSTSNLRRADRYHRRVSSLFFNFGVLIILLLLTAVFSMFFIIPSIVSYTSQIFRPNTVKKSWDSINVVLVLFALVFGFLSRNRNEDEYQRTGSNVSNEAPKSDPSTPHQWYDFSDQTASTNSSNPMGGLRRHRTSSSYPDLRDLSPWIRGDDPWRFSDDTQVNSYGILGSDHLHRRRSWRELDRQDSETKDIIHADTLLRRPEEVSYTRLSQSPPPPPQVPPPAVKKKAKRTYQSLAQDEEKTSTKGKSYLETKKHPTQETDPPPEPSSPPPTLPTFQDSEQKSRRSERKRGGANATKDFLNSFYKKKKRQRQKSVDNLDTLLHHPQPAPHRFQLPPPSPPPPPPPYPPSVFHNLFSSKKDNRKIILSATYAPPSPQPRPSTVAREPIPRTQIARVTTHKHPLPVKTNSFNSVDESSSGGESPMRRIPRPPPLPPFKMPDWKFIVEGDYVRVQSTHSSRSGSPDLDDVESPSSESQDGTITNVLEDDGDETPSPLFCPSPDVDTKADSFIAKFKAGLKLEKFNSFNQKQGQRMSNLGPGSGPSHL